MARSPRAKNTEGGLSPVQPPAEDTPEEAAAAKAAIPASGDNENPGAPGEATGAADQAAPVPQKAAPPPPVIVVTALQPRRWRIGRPFGAEPVTILLDELSANEIAALHADPLLRVEVPASPATA